MFLSHLIEVLAFVIIIPAKTNRLLNEDLTILWL
jgi:hypothetical protein